MGAHPADPLRKARAGGCEPSNLCGGLFARRTSATATLAFNLCGGRLGIGGVGKAQKTYSNSARGLWFVNAWHALRLPIRVGVVRGRGVNRRPGWL